MRILLVDSHFVGQQNHSLEMIAGRLPSLGLLSIAAVMRKQHEVSILDCQFHSTESARREILHAGADLVAVSATTPWKREAFMLAGMAKDTKAFVVMGGHHASIAPEECLATGVADAVVLGESDATFPELCTALEAGFPISHVKGIGFLQGGSFLKTAPRPLIEDLDRLPMPAWDLVPTREYFSSSVSRKHKESIVLVTSRGCPWKCSFCSQTIFGHRFRARSARLIIEEMRYLHERYGKRDFTFFDDVFTLPRKRILEFCKLLIQERMDVHWSCETRGDLVDKEILSLMRRAGCHTIGFGVESGNQSVLDHINKSLRLRTVERAARIIREAGIRSKAYFLIGLPGETEEHVKETLRFARSLPVDFPVVDFFYPLPGTDIYEKAMSEGELLGNEQCNNLGRLRTLNYVPHTLTPEFLSREYMGTYRRIYLGPWKSLRYVTGIRSVDEVGKAMHAVWRLRGYGNPTL